MRLLAPLAVIAAVSSLCAPALAGKPPGHAKNDRAAIGATGPTGPNGKGSPPSQAKAYGRYCKDESKRHVPGQKGTPFSRCVTAMAKLDKGSEGSPQAACGGMSKRHEAGQKGTPFSRCVAAAARLRAEKHG